MKLSFVSEDVISSIAGRKPIYPWAEFFEELYKHPNKWAQFPVETKNASSAYTQAKKYKDIEVRVKKNTDSGDWMCFFRFVQEEEVF